jgi:hypothetical protein
MPRELHLNRFYIFILLTSIHEAIEVESDSDESLDEIPARSSSRKEQQPVEEHEDDEEDEAVDGEYATSRPSKLDTDLDELTSNFGRYVVEAIVDHMFDDGVSVTLDQRPKARIVTFTPRVSYVCK